MTNTTSREARLHEQLLAASTDRLAPPYVDPRAAALVALGVVDFAKSPEGRARFSELQALGAFDPEILDDLAQLAQALLRVLEAFDVAPRDPRPVTVPQELDDECRARRGRLVALLSERAPFAPGVEAALRRVKLAYGPVDLAVDLRALAALVERNELDATLPSDTRALARRLEEHLIRFDTPSLREARSALCRVWALFESKYQEVAELGRELFSDEPEAVFPTLDAIASIERSARGSSSSHAPAALLVQQAMPASVRNGVSSRRTRAVRHPIVDQTPLAPPLPAEVHLDHASDSNLWLGFSEDISEGGVFMATYAAHDLGTPLDLLLHVVGREPVAVSGVVHWVRPHRHGEEDVAPGVGVRFTKLLPQHARALQAFAESRTPIFYDD
ncbi:MAG: PilZ domain-containing protein [Deltaproteobacteria bacterium]|nr:PilZ domain-containing protein [Deltaproteobacteria bacterium]